MPNSKWSLTGRYEWFDDANGFAMLGASLGATNVRALLPIPLRFHSTFRSLPARWNISSWKA